MPKPIDVVEALLFASDVPLEAERIREVLDLENLAAARELVGELVARYEAEARGLAIMEAGGGWRMVTRPELAPWLVRLARARTRVRLSRPALETLAIVAYKQPVSRPSTICSSAGSFGSVAARTRPGVRSSTRRRASSSSPSACVIRPSCRKSRVTS